MEHLSFFYFPSISAVDVDARSELRTPGLIDYDDRHIQGSPLEKPGMDWAQ
jgi:hypothetical protein